MKVLIATDCYIFNTGGITNVVLSLENGLREKGHEVKILTLSDSCRSYRDGDRYFIRSFRVYPYPELRGSFVTHDPFLEELKAWDPDIIHIHTEASVNWMAKAIARETDTPVVMTTHTDFEYFNFGRFRGSLPVKMLFRAFGAWAYRQAETVVVPAEKARTFPHLYSAADHVTVIPNGIQLERYQKPVTPEEKKALFRRYGLRDNGCTLVMVSRLSREKNVMEILRYFPALLRKVPEAQLVIVGFGPDQRRLESFCARAHLNDCVRFTGRIPPEDVYRYYAMGDIFVSASMFEVHSMSYLEAMACGLPLVCRDDASLRGVLDDGVNGRIYHNEREFVRAVSGILEDRTVWEQMHEKTLLMAETFTYQRFVERTLDLYQSVCQKWASQKARTETNVS